MLVDTRPYPAVQRCPDAKTVFDGKDLFNVAQAVHSISGSMRQISFLATLDTCFSVKRNTLSFGTQAASTVNLTEGYPCVHSRTISYKLYDVTVRVNMDKTGTSLLTEITKVSTRCISVSIFLLLLFCDYTMYIYFSVQTSSLVSFNVFFGSNVL